MRSPFGWLLFTECGIDFYESSFGLYAESEYGTLKIPRSNTSMIKALKAKTTRKKAVEYVKMKYAIANFNQGKM